MLCITELSLTQIPHKVRSAYEVHKSLNTFNIRVTYLTSIANTDRRLPLSI